jgi:hypothetical protein
MTILAITVSNPARGAQPRDLLLKYLAKVRARVTPFRFNLSSAVIHGATSTIASVASPRGAWIIA